MAFTYKLESIDFLQYQLFTASKSKRITNKKMYGWLGFTIASFAFAIYCYFNNSNALAIYFGVIAAVWGLFYPKYFSWKYHKHYKSFINENYKNRFGKTTTVTSPVLIPNLIFQHSLSCSFACSSRTNI